MAKVVNIVTDMNVLHQSSSAVSKEEAGALKQKLLGVMVLDNMNGVRKRGLAAIQLGIAKRALVLRLYDEAHIAPNGKPSGTGKLLVMFNPVFVALSESKVENYEGCLSVRGHYIVERYEHISVNFDDDKMARHTITLTGINAFTAQHEINHLDGITIADCGRPAD